MQKKVILLLVTSCLFNWAFAQDEPLANWSLSLNGGALLYRGDLSYKGYSQLTPAAALGAEIEVSPSIGLQISGLLGTLHGNDRMPSGSGELNMSNPNFTRALNFRTRIRDVGISAIYYTDNGLLLKKGARLAPYAMLGVGFTNFQVFADLYYGENQNQRYHYWQDGSIRNLAENGIDAGDAQTILQDGEYETNVTNLGTEAEGIYPSTILNIPVGIGVRYRVIPRLAIHAALQARFTFSDYLDDVSGSYKAEYPNAAVSYAANPTEMSRETRGNPNGNHDMYWYPSLGVSIRLGKTEPISSSTVNKKSRDPDGLANSGGNTKLVNYPDGSAEEVEVVPFDITPADVPVRTTSTGQETAGRDTVFVYKTDTLYAGASNPDTVYKYIMLPEEKQRERTSSASKEALESLYTKLLALNAEMAALKKRNEQLDELTRLGGPGGNSNIRPEGELRSIFPKLRKEVIYYGFGEYEVSSPQQERLYAIVELMRANPSIGLLISGHADPTGDPAVNLYISRLRAEAATRFLKKSGVDPTRITTRFYGEAVPTTFTGAPSRDNDTERRVEVDFIKVK